MKKIKFKKIREALEKKKADSPFRIRTRSYFEILDEIEEFPWHLDEIKIHTQMRWGKDGTEWKATAKYYDPNEVSPKEIETMWFDDNNGQDKETTAICRALNSIYHLRYRLCFAEEMFLSKEWFGDRATFFGDNSGVGELTVPNFVVTGGIKGLKRAIETLGYKVTANIPLTFKWDPKALFNIMEGGK